ncbi:MAG: flagellar export chaperone FlgN [Oscillospiraceae bacterium]|nr:flagellar export chaperone FlgN [Oscillospiraceae bacterium]
MLNKKTVEAVIRCLEIDCDFYRELSMFLMKKHTKILEDDLEWLTASLNDEQAYVMKSQNLENKRLELFAALGIADRKLNDLIADAPEDYQPKLKMLGIQLTELVDGIKEMNQRTNEIVKRKLDNQEEFVKRAGIFNKPETYDKNASKVTRGSSSTVIREV